MLDQWVYQPGLPANVARPDPAAFADVDQAVAAFAGRRRPTPAALDGWTTAERLRFLNSLPRKLPDARLDALEPRLRPQRRPATMRCCFAWLELAVANRYDPAVPALEQFLTAQGRRKFVRPLITALAEDPQWGRPIAARIYRQGTAVLPPGDHPRPRQARACCRRRNRPIFNREVTLFGLSAGCSAKRMTGCTRLQTVTSV